MGVRVWLAAAAMCAATMGLSGQTGAGAAPGDVGMMAADADPDWDVVTVKPSDPNELEHSFMVRGRHVMVHNQTVEEMLMAGYSLQKDQIQDAPEWVKTQRWDVDGLANVDGQPAIKQFQSMVRKLMLERFGLKEHTEQREMPVFALTVGKEGPKLSPTKSAANALPREDVRSEAAGERTMEFTNISMRDFGVMMLYYADKPVVDHTGLTGKYDFTLKYTYDEERAPKDGSAPPSIFTAVQEQLGLKLEAMKAPADVLVVDRVERPEAN